MATKREPLELLPGGRWGMWVGIIRCSLMLKCVLLQLVTPFAINVKIAPRSVGALSELARRSLWH